MNVPTHTPFCPIEDVDGVDLSRHALIEASAGTGKTYTIENLVVRLLKEEADLDMEHILLVTFTEKATSELKNRIREKIERTLDEGVTLERSVRGKLTDALDNFDNANITTIHGFCHTLIKEFPFETGNLFHQEIIDDRPLLERLLKTQMRSEWPRQYGSRLAILLDLVEFSDNPDRLVHSIIDLAQRLAPGGAHETLIPDPAELDVDALWQATLQTIQTIKVLVGDPIDLISGYERLNINKRTKSAVLRDMVAPIGHALAQMADGVSWYAAFRKPIFFLKARHASGLRNIDRLVPSKWLKGGENLHECPNLPAIRDRLDQLAGLFERLSHVLTLNSVDQLRSDARAAKIRNGWISYQDMLERVAAFLTGAGADDSVLRVRRRYRVAFVDEFQDTDAVQWQIFKTLFLDPHNDAGNRLFLIGDPKQAIYAFRGADVYTYLDARQRMKLLAAQGLANLYALHVNWRSLPELVTVLNRLFIQTSWFDREAPDDPYHIGFSPTASPSADQTTARVSLDRSHRPPFNVVDLTRANSHAAAKIMLAGFICREIRHLVDAGNVRITDSVAGDRPLHFGDMAILVRSQSESAAIEPLLNDWSIPYAYYRKPGLFQSQEAYWLSAVLHAIDNPDERAVVKLAMLTPFFDMPPNSLCGWEELPREHAGRQLLDRWGAAAHKRRWGALFQSLLEESGLIIRRCTEQGWARTESNLLQLFDYIEETAYLQNLNIGGVAAHLDRLRLSSIERGSDADVEYIEDDREKVQILTMHVSKGLEFPVVFIAGGLTERNSDTIHTYHIMRAQHPDRACRKVIDLTARTNPEQAARENEEEKKRLYYVSLTRSRIKLYLPYLPATSNHSWVGPICRFVADSIDQAKENAGEAFPINGWHCVAPETDVAPDTEAGLGLPLPLKPGPRLPDEDLLPKQTDFRNRQLALESFSSIAHRMNMHTKSSMDTQPFAFSLIEAAGKDADEPLERADVDSLAPESSDRLPGGVSMGSMFHHIFESIDFQSVAQGPPDILQTASIRQVVDSAMSLYRIDPRWMPQIARIVANTLRTPIFLHGSSVVLGNVPSSQRRHEMEFYFPLLRRTSADGIVPECTVEQDRFDRMLIRGFVDLIFVWQDRYYVADWKSNRLGDGYHQRAMAHEIASAGYDLQYRLYSLAALRWLKQRLGDRFDPERHFGGAIYIFIRGVNPDDQAGIFHVGPESLLPEDSLQAILQQQIEGIRC